MTLLLTLLAIHFLGDFYLQKDEWINCKIQHKHKSLGLFKHILVHLLLTTLVITFLSSAEIYASIAAVIVIVGSHYLIDIWKTYQQFSLFSFLVDQCAHLIVIVVVSAWLSGIDLTTIYQFINQHWQPDWLVIFILYLFAFKPVSLLLFLILRPYTQQLASQNDASTGLKNAGEHIGYLERGLIVTFILFNQFTAVGFLLAAKSVFRFGDMRRESDRKLTEYIMLGTLFSFSFAILIGELGKYIVVE